MDEIFEQMIEIYESYEYEDFINDDEYLEGDDQEDSFDEILNE